MASYDQNFGERASETNDTAPNFGKEAEASAISELPAQEEELSPVIEESGPKELAVPDSQMPDSNYYSQNEPTPSG